ncbi:hypothetical protein I5E68_04715 [Novosphingobium sp. YJ-S2-02]|uniref:Uncharacterized protein n=1 Tax=Novosphingobium aureum TaxID=2792964 RepID=A0A931MKR1_9SPHN|nr:hypothetical protein [Novosphingobium aureum]MBH0112256.1 hypothetical protein [Novosphingobium aureum]
MKQLGRDVPIPAAMQGRWIDAEDSAVELVVEGGEVTCFGQRVEYDYKLVDEENGALTVTLMVDNAVYEESFQRSNITGLVLTPEGEFHAYNVKFASQFIPTTD